jgi:phosphoribosylamine--glycine ligase
MRVLVVGGGGREHALAWKIVKSPKVDAVLAAPGSDAIAAFATCFPEIKATDSDALIELARTEGIGLVVIGPEDPLAAGLADRLREADITTFGPSAFAAQLESSKSFAKRFMRRHGIPTADFREFSSLDDASRYVRELGGACVVKADGLAAGKGVAVCSTPDEAQRALVEIMEDRRFGDAGSAVVVEELLVGEEVSYYAISDGEHIATLAPAQDHKRALDGDRGENTGGMGAYSPVALVSEATERRIVTEVVEPTVRGMAAEGHPFSGVLYVGLMVDAEGAPRVVEFNVRFGDPETQPLLMRMEDDLFPILYGSARGKLDPADFPKRWGQAAVCVVLASAGYPRAYETGVPIEGLAEVEGDPDVIVFHAGTRRGADGGFVTAGGRVLGVTARGHDVAEAAARAYAAADRIRFRGMQLRRDIAATGIASRSPSP